jgi:hypothetical protein
MASLPVVTYWMCLKKNINGRLLAMPNVVLDSWTLIALLNAELAYVAEAQSGIGKIYWTGGIACL